VGLIAAHSARAKGSPDTIKNVMQVNQLLAGPSRTSPERPLVPEEHTHRAPKRLISRENLQLEITSTINNTNTSSGKGWMFPDGAKYVVRPPLIVVAIRRAKGVIIIVAEQLVFLEVPLGCCQSNEAERSGDAAPRFLLRGLEQSERVSGMMAGADRTTDSA
jgi:hypothetical protein